MKSKRKEFNWLTCLNRLVKRKTPLPIREYEKLAWKSEKWPTCACGQLCKALPKDGNAPLDSLLWNYGTEFCSAVLYEKWISALRIFKLIETRTAELLKEMA